AARHVLLVECRAIRRAHRARVEFAAMAVVVAHLDGRREAAAAILRPHFVLGPVEARDELVRAIARLEAEQAPIVHLRRRDDLAGIHQAFRIERALALLERARQPRPVHALDPLRADEAVAVLAGVRALVLLDERASLFGDG